MVIIGAVGGGSSSKNTDSSGKPAAASTASSQDKQSSPTAQPPSAKTTAGAPVSAPKGDPDVDKRTRAYLNAMSTCETAVGLVLLDIKRGKLNDITLADEVTKARDICNSLRSRLATMDTHHFDDQAALGFYAINRYKSGLNATLAYIDNPRPSKVIEARNKLQDGHASATEAMKQINARRHVYNLKSYHP